jgi:hypothetical protein
MMRDLGITVLMVLQQPLSLIEILARESTSATPKWDQPTTGVPILTPPDHPSLLIPARIEVQSKPPLPPPLLPLPQLPRISSASNSTHRKCLNSLISLSVLWQNISWSKGVIRLMATLVPDATCTAELRA